MKWQISVLLYFTVFVAESSSTSSAATLRFAKQYIDSIGSRPGSYERECPLCDSSVYSYCGNKLLHDACCCSDPRDPTLPYQCRYADCSFLHANTCKEHLLITRCCCSKVINYFTKFQK